MNNTGETNHFSIKGKDGLSSLIVYKVPAAPGEDDGEFLVSLSGAGPSVSITLSDDAAADVVRLLAGLICTSANSNTPAQANGPDLQPLSPPLQNLLRHIQHGSGKTPSNENK